MPQPDGVQDKGLLVAALFALVTNWEDAETRTGRRGDYRTTGASMYRLRNLDEEELDQVKLMCGVFGLDYDEDDLAVFFAGDYEYQVSYACNRFATKAGGLASSRLTSQERRTLDRAAEILASKEDVARPFLTTPRRAA